MLFASFTALTFTVVGKTAGEFAWIKAMTVETVFFTWVFGKHFP